MVLGSDFSTLYSWNKRKNHHDACEASSRGISTRFGSFRYGSTLNGNGVGDPSTCSSSRLQQKPQPRIIRLNDSTHFHYETVELGPIFVKFISSRAVPSEGSVKPPSSFGFCVESNGKKWTISRTLEELVEFDRQLHRCVFDRRHSRLLELGMLPDKEGNELSDDVIIAYVNRLSQLTGSLMRCYPVLRFLELDSQGNRFVPVEHSHINIPAITVAVAVKPFIATKPNHLTLNIGDIVSIVEMSDGSVGSKNSVSASQWWRGKLTIPKERRKKEWINSTTRSNMSNQNDDFDDSSSESEFAGNRLIGYFPSNCVRLFNEKPAAIDERDLQKRQFQQHAKLDCWWPNGKRFMAEKLPKRCRSHKSLLDLVVQSPAYNAAFSMGSVSSENNKKRAFGMELEEHLAATEMELPSILTECIKIIEKHGIVTGIYRQCGIQSNIRKIRSHFDNGRIPVWDNSILNNDIHCVSSLLKQYFRLLPNSLFPSQLYNKLIDAYVSNNTLIERISKVRAVIKLMPPGHYRTAKYLLQHLSRMAKHKHITDMNASNLAIVWAPNLIWSPPRSSNDDTHLLIGLDLHKSLCNFLILYTDVIFEEDDGEVTQKVVDEMSESEAVVESTEHLGHRSRLKADSMTNASDETSNNSLNTKTTSAGGGATAPCASMENSTSSRDSFTTWRRFTNNAAEKASLGDDTNRNLLVPNRPYRIKSKSPLIAEIRSRSVDCVRRSESMLCHLGKNINVFGSSIMRRMKSTRKTTGMKDDSDQNPDAVFSADIKDRLHPDMLGEFERKSRHRLPRHQRLKIDQYQQQNESSPFIARVDGCLIVKERKISPPNIVVEEFKTTPVPDLTKENCSSAESLPLDVSRYDNIQNNCTASAAKARQKIRRARTNPIPIPSRPISMAIPKETPENLTDPGKSVDKMLSSEEEEAIDNVVNELFHI